MKHTWQQPREHMELQRRTYEQHQRSKQTPNVKSHEIQITRSFLQVQQTSGVWWAAAPMNDSGGVWVAAAPGHAKANSGNRRTHANHENQTMIDNSNQRTTFSCLKSTSTELGPILLNTQEAITCWTCLKPLLIVSINTHMKHTTTTTGPHGITEKKL